MRSDWVVRWTQFRVLYRVFFLRVIDMELMSADADPVKLFGQFATIFASISFLFALPSLLILMGGGHMNPIDAWGLEHFFIETTITIAGLVAVLNWETAFPDKKDVLVLAPLPVRASTLFVAKVAALFAAPFLALILLNVFCGITWPFVFGGASYGAVGLLRALPAYWLTIVLWGRVCCLRAARVAGDRGESAATAVVFAGVRGDSCGGDLLAGNGLFSGALDEDSAGLCGG